MPQHTAVLGGESTMLKSLGLIETMGLTAGIEAADAAVKSANVKLIGYELSKGSGMTVIKIEGDVGAVKAAIDAATVAAQKVSKVVSTKVIPRPANGLEKMIHTKDTVGWKPEPVAPTPPVINEPVLTEPLETPSQPLEATEKSEEAEEEETNEDSESDRFQEGDQKEIEEAEETEDTEDFEETDISEETEPAETVSKEKKGLPKRKKGSKPKK